MIDDYHDIHAKKVPTQLITSSAVHMASCLVDIQPTIMAVACPLHTPIHRVVRISIRGEEIDCYGGIDIQVVNQKMQQALANMKSKQTYGEHVDKVNYVEMKHVSELAIIGLLLKPFKT